jgi:hypothetical protein
MLAFILLIAPVLLPLVSIIAALEVMVDWHLVTCPSISHQEILDAAIKLIWTPP